MRCVLAVALVAAVACGTAWAGDNPDIRIYLDVDPPNYVHRIDPDVNDMFDVYICLDTFGEGAGTRGVGVLFDRTFGGIKTGQTNLLGGLDMGDVEVDGWSCVAGADCVYPDENGIVTVGYVSYLYTGAPGGIAILEHPVSGTEVLDCNDIEDHFIVIGNLGVNADPPEAPVEARSWGSIKALYR